jgi:hypothetical protein
MNRLVGVLIFCLCLPYSACRADSVEIGYGFTHVKFFADTIPAIKIDHSSGVLTGLSLSLVGTAEAAVVPDQIRIMDFERICNAISYAGRLEDLAPVLLDKDLLSLKLKVKDGVSSHVVLASLQAMHPRNIRITDSRIEQGRAEFAVTGFSAWGPVDGLMRMVKADEAWKIEDATWNAGKYAGPKDGLLIKGFNRLSDPGQYAHPLSKNFVSGMSPDYSLKKGPLQLNKVANNRRKRAFMFVFLMDKEKPDPDQPVVEKKEPRGRVHVMGSKKIFPEQQLVSHEYPIDISAARYEEGFAPETWNLVLPRGKPREITVSWMWSF